MFNFHRKPIFAQLIMNNALLEDLSTF